MRESRKRRLETEETTKRFKALNVIIIAFAIIMALLIVCFFPIFKVRNGVIKRNISYYLWLLPDAPEGRNVAWDSELPFFVKSDIDYAERHEYSIEYAYKDGATITINWEDGIARLKATSPHDYIIDSITNFSFYKDESGNLIIYGYYGDWFGTYEWEKFESLYEDSFYFSSITYDYNLPFDKNSYSSTRNGQFSLSEEVSNGVANFTFYEKGKEISNKTFPEKVKLCDDYTYTIITENDELYLTVSDYKDPDKPTVEFVNVGKFTGIECIQYEYLRSDNLRLPVLVIDSDYYTIYPKDWNTIKKFAFLNLESKPVEDVNEPDFSMGIVKLSDYFENARFEEDSGDWRAFITFNINGENFSCEYEVNGYDSSVGIYTNEVENLSRTVNTLTEFWDTIDEIRYTYSQRYDQRPDGL